jgi:hypothetical protein
MERFGVRNLPDRLVEYRVHGGSVSATRKETAQRLVRQVVERELARAGRRGEFTDEEVTLLARFRWAIEPEEVEAMLRLINRLEGWQEMKSPDLRRTLAWVHVHLGYGLLARGPLAGLREIVRATMICPRYGLSLPWLKILALAVLGDRARRLFIALRGASAAISPR